MLTSEGFAKGLMICVIEHSSNAAGGGFCVGWDQGKTSKAFTLSSGDLGYVKNNFIAGSFGASSIVPGRYVYEFEWDLKDLIVRVNGVEVGSLTTSGNFSPGTAVELGIGYRFDGATDIHTDVECDMFECVVYEDEGPADLMPSGADLVALRNSIIDYYNV